MAVLLTVAGGFLDAFTYVGHGHVFANAMTGNVALMAINAAAGAWAQAERHVPPLLAFMVAVFVAHVIGTAGPTRLLRHPALACLAFEALFLAAGAALAKALPDAVLIPGISFVATLQTTIFNRVRTVSYTSVMTTGNLRHFAQNLFAGTIPHRDPAALRDAALFGMVSLCFLAGAFAGAVATMRAPYAALWIPVALLAAALLSILYSARRIATPR